MEPMTMLAVASVAAPIIGGIMGQGASASARAAAQAAYSKAYAQYDNINIPEVQKQELALKSPEVQGILQPYMQENVQQGRSAMEGIQTDPRLAQAQMNALDTMSKMGNEGLTATDRASLNATRRQIAGDSQARQNSIIQQLAQRGAAGGGLELATRLAASQGSADQAGQESDRTMAMAQQRMLAATAQAGAMGGQMRGQEFGEQSQQAQAADAIERFNAQQRAAAQSANINSLNTAQAANLAAKQRAADLAVATANTQEQYNKGLIQQEFNNKMGLASARANAAVGAGNNYNNQAQQQANMYAGIGAGAGQAMIGAGTMYGKYNAAKPPADTGASSTYIPYVEPGTGSGPVAGKDASYVQEFSKGGVVAGEAPMPGDNQMNDTVHAKLSPGEIVIPRSHAISPDLAKAYINHLHKVSKGKA